VGSRDLDFGSVARSAGRRIVNREGPGEFSPSGFFVLRTPLLPFDDLVSWGADLEAPGSFDDDDRLESALARDRGVLRRRLAELLAASEIGEAIFIASPSLHDEIDRWNRDPESKKGKRAELALIRYFLRMCGRPTPFGLFAGSSVGEIASETRLELPKRESYGRRSRIDMDYVFSLAEALGRDPRIRGALPYSPNSSLYKNGNRLHYAEARLAGTTRSYHLVAVDAEEYLETTLRRARGGASLESLAASLADDDDEVTLEDAREFVHELVDNQILVSHLTPPITGDEATRVLLEDLHAVDERPEVAVLEGVQERIGDLDRAGLGNPPARYREIAERLRELPVPPDVSRLFQVDLIKSANGASLHRTVVDELARGVELLHRISSPESRSLFTSFIDAFGERFEDREVPLNKVLDEEIGIGFLKESGITAENAPLLEGIDFPPAQVNDPAWKPRHTFLLGKLEEAYLAGSHEIALDDGDVAALAGESPLPLPDAFEMTATLSAPNAEAIDRGEFRVLFIQGAGPSGARMMGRFCHGDANLGKCVRAHVRDEEALRPDAVFAEVVHLPEGRLGNILSRPVLREYEIPFLGRPSVPEERQIPVDDLWVSVREGRVVLRSARLGKEVVPRMTNAHNYSSHSLGIYRFLCYLQLQGTLPNLGWDWGPLASARFLPRVVSGRAVLSCARWILSRDEIEAVASDRSVESYRAVQKLRRERRLPRYVLLSDADNRLPVDLDNVLAVETLVDLLRKRGAAILEELYPGPDELCVEGPEGRFTHEIQVPFVRRRTAVAVVRGHGSTAPETLRRRFSPGSEWLYAKVYCGGATADSLLREMVPAIVGQAARAGAVRNWFFIRYADPGEHLRLRFEGESSRLLGEVLPVLEATLGSWIEDGRIAKMQLDTYTREVDRYGGPEAMLIAEQIFRIDSEAVVETLALLAGDAAAGLRWQLAARGTDQLLRDFGFDLETRFALMSSLREGYGQEFHAGKPMRIQLGNRYRNERRALEALLDASHDASEPFAPVLAAFNRRSDRIAPCLERLRQLAAENRLTRPLLEVASSHVHMFVNRLVRSAHRAHELVLYDFLLRSYQSRRARAKKSERVPA
jgi:thiopeptide-type bacteriocin biosynthesis protein